MVLKALGVRSLLGIHVLRLGLENVRAVSVSATVCKFSQNECVKVTREAGNCVLSVISFQEINQSLFRVMFLTMAIGTLWMSSKVLDVFLGIF